VSTTAATIAAMTTSAPMTANGRARATRYTLGLTNSEQLQVNLQGDSIARGPLGLRPSIACFRSRPMCP